MAIRVYKPMTPGTRQRSVLTGGEITKTTPEKSLTKPIKKNDGRNNQVNIDCKKMNLLMKHIFLQGIECI